MTFKNINRILLIKLREVGDLLLTEPVVHAVKETYPDSYLAMMVNSGTEDVVTENLLIDKVYVFDRASKKLSWLKKCIKQIKLVREIRREKFDLVVDFTGGDRAAICALFSGAAYKVGFESDRGFPGKRYIYTHRVPYPSIPKHSVEKNLDLVRPFGIDTQDSSPKIFFSKKAAEYISAIFADNHITKDDLTIHIHPTSKWLFKCWKDEYVAGLIDYLIETHQAKVIVTCGISEKEMNKAAAIVSHCRNKPVSLIESGLTLKHLAALSKVCDLFIGIDTGPMHIAAAVKTPVIAMFGPSGPVEWRPWGDGHVVIQSPVHDCMPCGEDGCGGSKRSECLESITVEMVTGEVNTVIKRIRPLNIKRVLVVSTTAIGDTLLGTPAIRALKESYPGVITDMLVHTNRRDLLEGNPHIDNLYSYRNNSFSRQYLYLVLSSVEYDYIIILHTNKDVFSLLTRLRCKKIITCQNYSDEKAGIKQYNIPYTIHAAERRLRLVEAIGGNTQNRTLDIFLDAGSKKAASDFLTAHGISDNDLLVGIQPAAANVYKRWPVEYFSQVIRHLKKRYNAKIVVTGSKKDTFLYNDLINVSNNGGYPFTKGLSIRESACVIKRCNLFITVDTGPMHIAFAVGTPTIALFCPSDGFTIGPYNCASPHIVINKPPPCDPCITKKCNDPFCMKSITVQEVVEAADQLLSDPGG